MTTILDDETQHRPLSKGSVLRWMGSKKRIADSIVKQLPALDVRATYFEPFFGGGSVFFAYGPHRSVLADSNASLMNAWRWIQADGEAVWKSVAALDASESNYYSVRASRAQPDSFTDAVRFIYLNRYCFNGIYRTNKRDEFNVPFGANTGALPRLSAFESCAEALAGSVIRSGDFAETVSEAVEGDIVYMDPPWQAIRATYGEYGYTPHLEVTPERVLDVALDLRRRGATTFISLPKGVASTFADWSMIHLEVDYRVASRHASRSRQTELLVTVGAGGAD